MGGGLVRGGSLGSAIALHQREARGIVSLLDNIETRDTRLLHAVPGILDRSPEKRRDAIRLHMDVDVHNQHRLTSC
jgi:hypothetical protein